MVMVAWAGSAISQAARYEVPAGAFNSSSRSSISSKKHQHLPSLPLPSVSFGVPVNEGHGHAWYARHACPSIVALACATWSSGAQQLSSILHNLSCPMALQCHASFFCCRAVLHYQYCTF